MLLIQILLDFSVCSCVDTSLLQALSIITVLTNTMTLCASVIVYVFSSHTSSCTAAGKSALLYAVAHEYEYKAHTPYGKSALLYAGAHEYEYKAHIQYYGVR